MALACFVWAALSIWLGHLVGANACGLNLSASVTNAPHKPVSVNVPLVWGWLVQVNAGPFYLFVAPVLLVVTHRFLIACGQALQQLHDAGRLQTKDNNIHWHVEMARRNRICALPIWLLPVFIFICLSVQWPSVYRALGGYPTVFAKHNNGKDKWSEIGYSQSIGFENWARDFNLLKGASSPESKDKKLAVLKDLGWLPALELALFDEMNRRNALSNSPLIDSLDFKDGKPSGLRLRGAAAITDLSLKASVLRSSQDSSLGWKKYAEGERRPNTPFVYCYLAFVAFEQIQIAAFFTFAAWLTIKIIFWLTQVYRMLPVKSGTPKEPVAEEGLVRIIKSLTGRKWYYFAIPAMIFLGFTATWAIREWLLATIFGLLSVAILRNPTGKLERRFRALIIWLPEMLWKISSRVRNAVCQSEIFKWLSAGNQTVLELSPVLSDPAGRYGIGALFRPYNLLVLTMAVGASYIALMFPSGVRLKDITSPTGAGSGASVVGHFVVITVAFSAVVCGPLWFFPRRLDDWAMEHRLKRLHSELSRAEHSKYQRKLLEEEQEIHNQSTWPKGDTQFKLTVAIILAVLLLPLGSALDFIPGDAVKVTRIPQIIRASWVKMVTNWYGLNLDLNE